MPTKEEMEEHMSLRLPYREWCPHGVAGKAASEQHKSHKDGGEKLGNAINMDYALMIKEERGDEVCPVLVLKDAAH